MPMPESNADSQPKVSKQGIEGYPDFPKVVVQVKDDEAELKTLKADEKEW